MLNKKEINKIIHENMNVAFDVDSSRNVPNDFKITINTFSTIIEISIVKKELLELLNKIKNAIKENNKIKKEKLE